MSTAETPLVHILAQLRTRAENWTREAAVARAALSAEIEAACRALETSAPPGDAAALAAPAVDVAALIAESRLALEAERDALRDALEASREALAQAEQRATPVVDDAARVALAQAQAALALALEDHAEALADRDARIATLEATVETQLAQLALVHAELRQSAVRVEAERVLVEQDIRAFDQHGHKRRMGVILVEAGVITQEQLDEILAEQAQNPQRRFGTIVVERGFTTEEAVARILAAQLRLPFLAVSTENCDAGVSSRISGHLARLHKAVPVREENGNLTVAMVNPLDLIAIEDIEIASRCRVEPVVATRSAIEAVLAARG